LPEGEWILIAVTKANGASGWDQAQIVAQSPKTGERKALITGGSDARYAPSGHLIYALRGALFAVPFDADNLKVTGEAVPVIEDVERE
jgi:hypothetical protein